MWDTIQKLEYRVWAGIADAREKLNTRLTNRLELPLSGLHGEKLFLTGMAALRKKEAELDVLYQQLPEHRGTRDTILLDAWSSATIEGARTTVQRVRECIDNLRTKDDRMVVNTIAGSHYAYGHPITPRNIRTLWEKVVDGVCENENCRGTMYRDGMVVIGSADRVIHVPAEPAQLPEYMGQWFAYTEAVSAGALIRSFVAHFYFVYLHPFCDGNGRTARILNASQLYHAGYRKMKSLPLSSAINNQLSGYYSSLADSETVLGGTQDEWLDLSPFVSFMMEAFEHCLIDAALAANALTEAEKKLLEWMNHAGIDVEITAKKAAVILQRSERGARAVLNRLVKKGYLTVDTESIPYVYRLHQHIPE